MAAERATTTAERRRAEWLAAQEEAEAAWQAYEAAEEDVRRLGRRRRAAAAAYARTPAEYADRERWLHRAALDAQWRQEITVEQLSDILAHRTAGIRAGTRWSRSCCCSGRSGTTWRPGSGRPGAGAGRLAGSRAGRRRRAQPARGGVRGDRAGRRGAVPARQLWTWPAPPPSGGRGDPGGDGADPGDRDRGPRSGGRAARTERGGAPGLG